jgi:hypothetical protein
MASNASINDLRDYYTYGACDDGDPGEYVIRSVFRYERGYASDDLADALVALSRELVRCHEEEIEGEPLDKALNPLIAEITALYKAGFSLPQS